MNKQIQEKILPKNNTRYLFFSGKGGVGKSTMSSSTAVWLASKGYKTLLVTTDPAPNLSDMFNKEIGHKITSITNHLDAIEINPDKASDEYREKTIEPMRAILDEKSIETVKEQLNSPCIEEIAAFDKFIEFMDEPEYDVVVFDTAPTGHTIRLLELPSGWSESLKGDSATCIGPSASLQEQKAKYEQAVKHLQDSNITSFVFVMKPEHSSITETTRSTKELAKLGITANIHIINGALPKHVCEDEFFMNKYKKEQELIKEIREEYGEIIVHPLASKEINGVQALEQVGKQIYEGIQPQEGTLTTTALSNESTRTDTSEKSTQLFSDKKYIFFTGKGGVGKSTFASTTALRLADEGYKILIVTTDPASHLQEIFEQEVTHEPTEIIKNLFAARIDQKQALEEYRTRILESVSDMDEDTQKSVQEDLNSPCAEEMAAFDKFMSYFALKGYEKIVFDTAPTGHTLRLLELPSDWKGFADLGSRTKETAATQQYTTVIDMMKDTQKTAFVFVMYPEYTPIIEAWRAAQDLHEQVGIQTAAVAINYVIPEDKITNAFFRSRKEQEHKYLHMIQEKFATPTITATMQQEEPRGTDHLRVLAQEMYGERT